VRLIIGAPRNYVSVVPDKSTSAAIAEELHDAVRELAQQHAGR
jgi:hypothetical protein